MAIPSRDLSPMLRCEDASRLALDESRKAHNVLLLGFDFGIQYLTTTQADLSRPRVDITRVRIDHAAGGGNLKHSSFGLFSDPENPDTNSRRDI